MRNLRSYGSAPFDVAVIHGGPGAPGEMAPVARELSSSWGVLEPLQTAATLEGQVQELEAVLEENGDPPVTLIGWSWGAWLSLILAARRPSLVGKLVLVGSGAFEERYALGIMNTRLARLGEEERAEAISLMEAMSDPATEDRNTPMRRFGELISKADSYDPMPHESEVLEYQHDVNLGVWDQAMELRRSGELLRLARRVKCPVVAIHGVHDPHRYKGVEGPLSRVLTDFRFILLERCGHQPWIERAARDRFYETLRREVGTGQKDFSRTEANSSGEIP